jgi:plastocyanin
MNTRKQVLIMASLLMVMLVTIGIYAAWLPNRQTDAEANFEEATAERGSIIFAQNCRLCHGDVGEGGAAGGRLPAAPALNRPDLQGFISTDQTITADVLATATTVEVSDSSKFKAGSQILIDDEHMNVTAVNGNTLTVTRGAGITTAASHLSGAAVQLFDKATLDSKITLITDTISCGRIGTAMPTWSDQFGGPLNAEQIRQLVTLISQGRWDLVHEEDNLVDKVATLAEPASADATTLTLSSTKDLTANGNLRIGDERMVIKNISDDGKTVEVERGQLNSSASEHAAGDTVYNFPSAPEDPTIVQSACGQTAKAAAPAGTPATIEPFTGQTVDVTAQNIAFNTKEITLQANGQVRVRLDNKDTGVQHNIAFYKSSSDITPVSDGSVGLIFEGPGVDDTVFNVPAAGTYYFRCDVHPTIMFGTLIVK